MPETSSTSEPKPVFDFNHEHVGDLGEATGPDRSSLEIHLAPDVQTTLDTQEETIDLPVRHVAAIRRDEIHIDATLHTLANRLDHRT